METQAAIVQYQNLTVEEEKNDLYVKDIYPAFSKLSENLIFVYGFKSPYALFEELKTDCVAFLYESIHKWKEERGTKAFSYFNVVAKNWLIINCRQHKKQRNRHVSVDDPYGMTMSQKIMFENHDVVPSPDEAMIKKAQRTQILSLLDDMRVRLTNKNELICLQAIETLFANIENLDLLNKRAVLIYIREISGLDKKYTAKALSVIRRHYRALSGSEDRYDIFF
jgi:DNA-directed RNA polymerase specialized sigma24 family protein